MASLVVISLLLACNVLGRAGKLGASEASPSQVPQPTCFMAVGEPDYVRTGCDLEKSTNRNEEGENHDVCGEEEERK